MGMFFTEYSQTYDSTIRGADDYHNNKVNTTIIEKTEDLSYLVIGNEQKKTYGEGGGTAYVKNGTLLQSSEFTILGQEIINGKVTTLSFKSYNGVPGLYRVSEDGVHEKLL